MVDTTDDEDEETIMYATQPCSDSGLMSRLKPLVLAEPDGRQFKIDSSIFINKFIFGGAFKEATCFFKITQIGHGEVQQLIVGKPEDFEAKTDPFYVCGGLGCDSQTWSPTHDNQTQPVEPISDHNDTQPVEP